MPSMNPKPTNEKLSEMARSSQYLNGIEFDEALENAKTIEDLDAIKDRIHPEDDKRWDQTHNKGLNIYRERDNIYLEDAKKEGITKDELEKLFHKASRDSEAKRFIFLKIIGMCNDTAELDKWIDYTKSGTPGRKAIWNRIEVIHDTIILKETKNQE